VRFIIQAISCLTHNAYQELNKIKCPTLIIGGGADKIIGGVEVPQEMAKAIPESKIIIYPELGHDADTKKFSSDCTGFFKKKLNWEQ